MSISTFELREMARESAEGMKEYEASLSPLEKRCREYELVHAMGYTKYPLWAWAGLSSASIPGGSLGDKDRKRMRELLEEFLDAHEEEETYAVKMQRYAALCRDMARINVRLVIEPHYANIWDKVLHRALHQGYFDIPEQWYVEMARNLCMNALQLRRCLASMDDHTKPDELIGALTKAVNAALNGTLDMMQLIDIWYEDALYQVNNVATTRRRHAQEQTVQMRLDSDSALKIRIESRLALNANGYYDCSELQQVREAVAEENRKVQETIGKELYEIRAKLEAMHFADQRKIQQGLASNELVPYCERDSIKSYLVV